MSVEYNLVLSDNLLRRLSVIATSNGITVSKVLANGIALLEIMVEAEKNGNTLSVIDNCGVVVSNITTK